jgi:hypothetical protein
MLARWLVVVLLAWVLWVDQNSYGVPSGPGDGTPLNLEGASARWQQLAVTETRAACRALRQARVQEAVRADAAQDQEDITARGRRTARYRNQYRYFCSPVVPGK